MRERVDWRIWQSLIIFYLIFSLYINIYANMALNLRIRLGKEIGDKKKKWVAKLQGDKLVKGLQLQRIYNIDFGLNFCLFVIRAGF